MHENLLKIYQDKIIINPEIKDYDKYYYFYGEDGKLFGIEKTITINEYKLIKSFYLEKTQTSLNKKGEEIYKYIYENGQYPFEKKMRFTVVSTLLNKEIMQILEEVFVNLEVIQLDKISVLFYEDDNVQNVLDIFQTISEDFGKQIFVHVGLILNKQLKGDIVAHYLGVLLKTNCLTKDYSNIADLIFKSDTSISYSLFKELKEKYFMPILSKNNNQNILDVYFQNDLNVSKSAKDLYLNRNSLINRLDSISKELGYDVQSFKIATVLFLVMNLK